MGKREQVAELLVRSGLGPALLSVRGSVNLPLLPILTYHRVATPGEADGLDDGVIDATPDQFDAQLGLLKEHFTFIGVEELLAWRRGRPLPPNPVLVTFDDGYLDCHTRALPLLQKHGAKAIFFIATHYLEHRRVFWWDRLSAALKRAQKQRLQLTYPHALELDLAGGIAKPLKTLLTLVKTHYGLDLFRFVEQVEQAADAPMSLDDERSIADRMLMTWDQVRDLRKQGMDVQSHTRTHRVLQTLKGQDLQNELDGSRKDLEAQLSERVSAVAYPVGYPLSGEVRIREALSEAGYEVGFTNSTGINLTTPRPDRFELRRIAMDVEFSDAFFRGIMAFPHLSRSRTMAV